jgi:hypothetical protein
MGGACIFTGRSTNLSARLVGRSFGWQPRREVGRVFDRTMQSLIILFSSQDDQRSLFVIRSAEAGMNDMEGIKWRQRTLGS